MSLSSSVVKVDDPQQSWWMQLVLQIPQNVQNQEKYRNVDVCFPSLYSNKPSPEEEAAPGFGSHSPVYKVSSSYGSDISCSQLCTSEHVVCPLLDVPAAS